ncbi:hypothetical protein Lal_00004581 [Lupinus albus]|uniref:Putative chromatin remodeling & transcriptional activation CHROMO-DOMAIN family n=1 Tax=Lupinus albus TaxID=3870 RepID=A0A6A4NDS3_LUPAL|nr:putative chromatin remodeling & transcriptional activation CHROMO-DOMAIN family [Lupinus albus]KAF1865207.1 hypothetical protein Lal_00004581 [Lupinus albus]
MGNPNVSGDAEVTENSINSDSDLHDSPPYAEGEKVFAYHSNRLYEAKVMRLDYKQKSWKFYVHYLGWKNSWDEWVDMASLMKHTEESKRKKDELDEKLGNDKNTKFARAGKTSNAAKGRKRRNESSSKGKSEANSDKLTTIQIPPTLKKQLVDDCEFVTHLGKLVKLPRTPNVNDILKMYLDQRLKKHGSVSDSVEEIMNGLGSYFDKALPVILLYNNERHQYQEACPNNITPSSIYGAEHLLRLLVKLPESMADAGIEKETVKEIQEQTVDFLRFLQRNHSAFFLSTYHVPEDMDNKNNKQGE